MRSKIALTCLFPVIVFCLSGCNYDFPLTAMPTRKIEARLLGDWVVIAKENDKVEIMHVRKFDESTYAVSMDNDIYRAFHSDFAGAAFLSVQDLNAGNRKYIYYTWQLSADATQLTLKAVRTEVVPENTKTPADIQQLIKENLSNPKLFQPELQLARKKSGSQ